MPDKTWKAAERRICKLLGGVRRGPTGRDDSDCVGTEPFAVEIKHRKAFPVWLKEAMAQSVENAKSSEIPIVVLHEHRQAYRDALVVVRLSVFSEISNALRFPNV